MLRATLTLTGRRVLLRGLALSAKLERYIWADANSSELRVMKRSLQTALERLQARTEAQNLEHQTRQQRPDRAASAAARKTA